MAWTFRRCREYLVQTMLGRVIRGVAFAVEGCRVLVCSEESASEGSENTTPCKVTPVILHGVVSPDGVVG